MTGGRELIICPCARFVGGVGRALCVSPLQAALTAFPHLQGAPTMMVPKANRLATYKYLFNGALRRG